MQMLRSRWCYRGNEFLGRTTKFSFFHDRYSNVLGWKLDGMDIRNKMFIFGDTIQAQLHLPQQQVHGMSPVYMHVRVDVVRGYKEGKWLIKI